MMLKNKKLVFKGVSVSRYDCYVIRFIELCNLLHNSHDKKALSLPLDGERKGWR